MRTSVKRTLCPLFLGATISLIQLLSGCAMVYNGENLFFTEGCSQCHTFRGKGGRMGPDLSAVTNIRSEDWINSYVHDPKQMNPLARMPPFRHLSSAKRRAIIAFLKE